MAQWDTDRILTIGRYALSFEDYVLSIQYFNQVIKIKPYLAEPYMLRASAKIQLGDFQGADQDCTDAIERNPFVDRAYYLRGFARKKMDYFDEAALDFTKALEFKPNDSIYILNRFEAYARGEKYSKAIDDIDYILKLQPQKYNLLYYKGNFQLELKDTLGAENSFNKIIECDSNSYMGWSGRGLIRMFKKDYVGALSDYNNAIKCKSTYMGDYVNRGNINNDKKNYNQALSDYNEAIKLDSTEDLAFYNRGLLRAYLGDKNNAINDLKKVIQLDSTKIEAYMQKAILEKSLGYYKSAITDFKIVLSKYPYYIPVYEELASIEEKLGNQKQAFYYQQKAKSIDLNKDYYSQKEKEKLIAKNQMVTDPQKGSWKQKNKLFYQIAMQNNEDSVNIFRENSSYKGTVQDRFTNLTNEKNFILSFITYKYQLRRTNLYVGAIDQYNKTKIVPTPLGISNIELPLTSELANYYFTAINKTTDSLSRDNSNADIYFSRALEFTSVKDYIGAVEDLNKAIELRPDFILAIFSRANIKSKLLDSKLNDEISSKEIIETNLLNGKLKPFNNSQFMFNIGMIIQDYDKVIELNPDFSFAYFNKANILCTQKDFKTAISNYSKAIDIDPDFAESYFNRGLTYLFIGEDAKGLADLSKAGELGIYSAYNLIQRFKKQQ
jgi:tetratricopeptide (TPR) repeat protein